MPEILYLVSCNVFLENLTYFNKITTINYPVVIEVIVINVIMRPKALKCQNKQSIIIEKKTSTSSNLRTQRSKLII